MILGSQFGYVFIIALLLATIAFGGFLIRCWGYRCSNDVNGCRHLVDTWHRKPGFCSHECKTLYYTAIETEKAEKIKRAEELASRPIVR